MRQVIVGSEMAHRVLARLVGWVIIGPGVCLQVQVQLSKSVANLQKS